MKKIILIVAVFMLAAPALARVDISCEQIDDTNEVVVYYDAEPGDAVEPNLIRAFAFDITLDTDATIVDVYDVNPYYWVFPGSWEMDPYTARCDWEEYDGTKGEEPNQMTTEQASLYSPDDEEGHTTPPGMSDDLFRFRIDASSGTHHVTIAQNTIRGGVVSEGIVAVPEYEPDVNCTPCTVILAVEDPNAGTCWDPLECVCQYAASPEDANTTGLGGDASCDGKVNFDDLNALKRAWGETYAGSPHGCALEDVDHYCCCADFTHDGVVNFDDLNVLKVNWNVGMPDDPCTPSTLEQSCPEQ